MQPMPSGERSALNRKAMEYILEAWGEAEIEGVDPDMLATAALFAGLSGLVSRHGEETVAELAKRLADRILKGEFSLVTNRH